MQEREVKELSIIRAPRGLVGRLVDHGHREVLVDMRTGRKYIGRKWTKLHERLERK
jgi:hypothetical protein